MANLLIVTRGLPSLVYPAVELARRLAADGHRVTFAGAPVFRALADRHQLGFLSLEGEGHDAAFADALRRERPDLALINGEMHEHIIVAAASGVRVALLNSFVSIWRRPGLPPPHHLARPGVGWKGTAAGMALLWENLWLRKLRRRWLERLRSGGRDQVSTLYAVADAVGFDRHEFDDRQWLIPFTYRRLPVLSLHALEFEFPHEPPDHVHYVGPMILGVRADREESRDDRERLAALIARHVAGGRTLIYAAFGSVLTTDPSFLRRLLGVVHGRTDWDLVLSLSGRLPADSLGPLPDGVHVFAWLPQVDVLAHADAAITHGGISSIDECVAAGVPVLVYCGGETDMAGATSRVVHHGIGIAGDRRRDATTTIRGHLDRLLAEPGFRQNVSGLQQSYAAYVEHRVAERTVAGLLAEEAPRRRERP